MKITYYHFSTIDSTNNFAKRNLATFDEESLSVVTSSTQTRGRGREQRSWISPEGKNIYLSLVLFQEVDPFFATQIASLAADDILHSYGIESRIKWPNDLVVHNKKIAGILTEKENGAIIIGMGLNVNMAREELSSISQPATSMAEETHTSYSVEEVTEKFVSRFATLLQEKDPELQQKWLERVSWMVGGSYELKKGGVAQTGTIASIVSDGTLSFRKGEGALQTVLSGDIMIP